MKNDQKSSLNIGLALGGGGAKGLCHIAFIKALDELGVRPKIISGTSIGAVIGAFYASGMTGREMESVLETLDLGDVNKLFDFSLFTHSAVLKGEGVETFLSENLPVKRFEELEIPLKIVSTDYWQRQQVIFDSGDLVMAIRASLSVPGLFSPVKHKGRLLIDGGAVNPLPYDLIREQCSYLIAVDVSGKKTAPDGDDPSILDVLLSTFQIMQASIVDSKRSQVKVDLYLKPELENVRILEFHRYKEIIKSVDHEVDKLRHALGIRLKASSSP
jgi:NTE family protein